MGFYECFKSFCLNKRRVIEKRSQSCSPSPIWQHRFLQLRVRVVKGKNLVLRDVSTSDPYVVRRWVNRFLDFLFGLKSDDFLFLSTLSIKDKKLKTSVVSNNVNPEWNEELTFSIADPIMPIKLEVFDKDTFTQDDPMGDAELDIRPFVEAAKMDMRRTTSATTLNRLVPSQENCLAEESRILWLEGKVIQDVCLLLQNVECGEVELQLQWISIPGSKHC